MVHVLPATGCCLAYQCRPPDAKEEDPQDIYANIANRMSESMRLLRDLNRAEGREVPELEALIKDPREQLCLPVVDDPLERMGRRYATPSVRLSAVAPGLPARHEAASRRADRAGGRGLVPHADRREGLQSDHERRGRGARRRHQSRRRARVGQSGAPRHRPIAGRDPGDARSRTTMCGSTTWARSFAVWRESSRRGFQTRALMYGRDSIDDCGSSIAD